MFRTKLGPGRKGPVWKKVKDELTFDASLLLQVRDHITGKMVTQCHLTLKKGMVKFLNDCDHSFKGQTVPVEEVRFGTL